MAVYFIQAGDVGPVKIGYARDPLARLADLQVSHWQTLHLLRTIEGGRICEQAMHRHYRDAHIRGEWFDFRPSMLLIVEADVPDIVVKPRILLKDMAEPIPGLVRAIEICGGPAKLGKRLGLSRTAVGQWKCVPRQHVLKVSEITGVPLEELVP